MKECNIARELAYTENIMLSLLWNVQYIIFLVPDPVTNTTPSHGPML